jgi:hypothetical protein
MEDIQPGQDEQWAIRAGIESDEAKRKWSCHSVS